MSALDDIVSTGQGVVRNLGQLTIAFQNAFPRINGTFTLSNATTTVITQPSVGANAVIVFTPTNAAAALLQRTAGVYQSAIVAGTSFSISTQAGSAAGTEVFSYYAFNPS